MTPGGLVEVLRWFFWSLVYLMTFFIALAAFNHLPVPGLVRLSMLAVVVFGVGVDIAHKRRLDAHRA